MTHVQTFRGPRDVTELGTTLIHEHLFVRSPELDLNFPDAEWDQSVAVERAVETLTTLHGLGVGTVVDLTVPGLGRDVSLAAQVADQVDVHLIASTGYYTGTTLPAFFGTHGPGRLIEMPDPLVSFFLRDIEEGIAGTSIRAGMLKVVTDESGITDDVSRIMSAAATAHHHTGVPITTHSVPAVRNGLEQQRFFREKGVAMERLIIGHSGDTDDLDYLKELMDAGSTIGMDRFGMEHVFPDDRRVETVAALVEAGYSDRMVLSHDAAIYSRVTPPSWRARNAPNWQMEHLSSAILPQLRSRGVADADVHQMMVRNPARLLTAHNADPGSSGSAAAGRR